MYRSKVTSLVFVVLLIVTSLLGCQPTAPATTASNQKSITIIIPEDPPSFNPIITDTGYDALVMELVMLGLSDIDPDGKVFPELAAELPTVENGGVVVDEDCRHHERDLEDAPGCAMGGWKTCHRERCDLHLRCRSSTLKRAAGSRALTTSTASKRSTIIPSPSTTTRSTPAYLTQFGGEQVVIWPAHYCDASQGFAAWECARKPLSNGPFVLSEWVNGDHMTFVRNDNYFEEGKPQIDTVTVRIIPDQIGAQDHAHQRRRRPRHVDDRADDRRLDRTSRMWKSTSAHTIAG